MSFLILKFSALGHLYFNICPLAVAEDRIKIRIFRRGQIEHYMLLLMTRCRNVFANIDQFSKESVASIFVRGLLHSFCEDGKHNFYQNIFNHVLKYTVSYPSIIILKIKDCCNVYLNKSTTVRKLYNHMTSFLHVSAFFGLLQEGIRQAKNAKLTDYIMDVQL